MQLFIRYCPLALVIFFFTLFAFICNAQQSTSQTNPTPSKDITLQEVKPAEAEEGEVDAAAAASSDSTVQRGTGVNLLGQVNTAGGEGRRNENVQINLVDNNAQRDINQRLGATATIIEEFRIERNYFSGEYGNVSKGPIHTSPQGGTGFHGNFFWGHNNSIFTARSFFQSGPVQPARQNQYGAAFSTRVWKDGFFTFSGSQDKSRGMVNGNVIILLPNEHTPLTNDPVLRPIVENLLSAYPNVAPNRTDISDRALNTNSPQTTDTNTVSGQLNQRVTTRDTLVLRYSFNGQQVDAFQFVRGQNPNSTNKSHSSRITWDRAWSPATITNFSFGFDRQTTLLAPVDGAVGPVYLTGVQNLGPTATVPLDRAQNQWLTGFSMQTRRGNHGISAGASLIRRQITGTEAEGIRFVSEYRNNFGNDAVTNLRLGLPSVVSQAFGNAYAAFRNWDLQVFAGDRWAVSNRLSLNFGVRWEPTTRPIDRTGQTVLPYDSDWNNVGGEFGFAYRLPGGYGVLRGAIGTMFGQIFTATYGPYRMNPPALVRLQIQAPDLRDPFAGVDTNNLPADSRAQRLQLSPDLATPYSYQYNFSWEAELRPGWRLQLGYVGSRSHKLFMTYVFNRAEPVPGIPLTIATINERRPSADAFDIYFASNGSNAYYDAARVTFNVPAWHGLTMTSSYWLSKAIDLGGDYTTTGAGPERFSQGGQTELGVHNDLKALSNFDQPHAFLLQTNYGMGRKGSGWVSRLWNNWNLSAVYLLKSGTPFSVDAGSDGPGFGNVDGTAGDRVNIINSAILGRTIGNPDTAPQILARSNFAFLDVNAGETRGNIGRNVFRKGKIANMNAALSRTWTLPHDWQMTFRAESINFTNTPQFASPGSFLASPNFGQITNTLNDGRTFRFTLRFAF